MHDKIDPPAQYWAAVRELLGSDPKQASTAIGLNSDQLRGITPQELLRPLLAALDGSFWQVPRTTTASNWTWRREVPYQAYLHLDVDQIAPPPGIGRDARQQGHWGTGDMELSLTKAADLDLVKPLVLQAYEGKAAVGKSQAPVAQ